MANYKFEDHFHDFLWGGGGELVPLGLSFMLNFSLRLLKMYWMRPISSIVVSKMMRLSLLVHYFSKKKCNIS